MQLKIKKRSKEGAEHSLRERWTPLIAMKGFAPVPMVFLENYSKLNITVSEAMLLVHLHQFKWTRESPFPSVTLLSRLMGCSTRNIRKLCASLESVGYLKRVERDGMSNLFDMSGLYAKLEDVINVTRPTQAAGAALASAAESDSAQAVG